MFNCRWPHRELLNSTSPSSGLLCQHALVFWLCLDSIFLEVFILPTISVSQTLLGMSLLPLWVWPGHPSDWWCVPQQLLVALPFTLTETIFMGPWAWARCCESGRARTLILITELRQPSLGYFTHKGAPIHWPNLLVKNGQLSAISECQLNSKWEMQDQSLGFQLPTPGSVLYTQLSYLVPFSLGECPRNWYGTHQTPWL